MSTSKSTSVHFTGELNLQEALDNLEAFYWTQRAEKIERATNQAWSSADPWFVRLWATKWVDGVGSGS